MKLEKGNLKKNKYSLMEKNEQITFSPTLNE